MEPNEIDWSGCPLIEHIEGKRSGEPVFVGSRLPSALLSSIALLTKPLSSALKTILDEDVPHQLRKALAPQHEVATTSFMGWSGVKNGAVLKLVEAAK